jgi:hypothetical protein
MLTNASHTLLLRCKKHANSCVRRILFCGEILLTTIFRFTRRSQSKRSRSSEIGFDPISPWLKFLMGALSPSAIENLWNSYARLGCKRNYRRLFSFRRDPLDVTRYSRSAGMKRIFWNWVNRRNSISSVSTHSRKPYRRDLVVSDMTSYSILKTASPKGQETAASKE